MKTLSAVTAVTFAIALLPIAANAQSVNRRLDNQHDRIQQGVRSGELTRREATFVRSDDRYIHSEERYDRSKDHGRLTDRERYGIERQLDRNSDRIFRLKHNCDERG